MLRGVARKNMAIGKKTLSTEKLSAVLTALVVMFLIGPILRTLVKVEIASIFSLYLWALITIVVILAYFIFSPSVEKKGTYVLGFIIFTLACSEEKDMVRGLPASPVLIQFSNYIIMWGVALLLMKERAGFLGTGKFRFLVTGKDDRWKERINPWK